MGAAWIERWWKKSSFWGVFYAPSAQQKRPISRADCDVWWEVDPLRQSATFGTVVGCRRSSTTLPEAEIAPKKVMVTVWWSAASLIHHNFLNLGETITAEQYCRQIDEMHEKLQRMCPRLVNMKGPILLHDNALTEAEWIGLRDSTSSAIFTGLLVHRLSLFQASRQLPARKMLQKSRWCRIGLQWFIRFQNSGFLC